MTGFIRKTVLIALACAPLGACAPGSQTDSDSVHQHGISNQSAAAPGLETDNSSSHE
ncbi:hypothetical protein [Brytella acorum]|uniref:Uncharacterized protein n=1 Tax=Brytella acorum TaxID=2959299 RepID=A0AA35Y4L0_9PROT|nr:hypothetical protein [Brytella acorum]MDF3625794.1 hypothetical protein [Brytella acorum]CAI9121223.1 hypothetical protein LMG32879_002070 [Brytella acorum]